MYGKLAFMAAFLLLSYPVFASEVDVEVSSTVNGSFMVSDFQQIGSFFYIKVGAHNTGSEAYGARVRADVVNGRNIIFTGWSQEKPVAPGEKKSFTVFGYRLPASNQELMIRIYHGNEIAGIGPIGLNSSVPAARGEAFSIENFRTYDDYMRFDLHSNRSLHDIAVFPRGFPGSWIIGQASINSMEANGITEVRLPYETGFFQKRDITIVMATRDGMVYQEQNVSIEREEGIMMYIHLLMDFLGGIFRL